MDGLQTVLSVGEVGLSALRATVRFTRGNADILRSFYRLPIRVRFDIIPPAVPFPDQPNRPEPGSMIRLLSVGRLVESKNVGFLLDCLTTMRDLFWRLDVVGDGPKRPELEATALRCGLADKIQFHGQRSDVGRYYRERNLFVFPSKLESFGLVMLEAMAHGVPTLAIKDDGERVFELASRSGDGRGRRPARR